MNRVAIRPEMLRWARERASRDLADLVGRFRWLPDAERGTAQPTMRQLEAFAKATRVPFGYLFLATPPNEPLPISDFRTVKGGVRRPSPDLLDTIYTMQRRQAWLRDDCIAYGVDPLDFVGSAQLTDDPAEVGSDMRRVIGLGAEWAAALGTWSEARSALRDAIEQSGVMAVVNGIVGNNTSRKLNVDEFRGFALCDAYAPLIFVNGADAKSAQMFTLAHELAHIWVGPAAEGLSAFDAMSPSGTEIEIFCDKVAVEFLLPASEFTSRWGNISSVLHPFIRLARIFKVSPIVVGRRAMDLDLIAREEFFEFYNSYVTDEVKKTDDKGGGNFYLNQDFRVGRMFALQVIRAAMEGRLSFRDAYDLVDLRGRSFERYAQELGVDVL